MEHFFIHLAMVNLHHGVLTMVIILMNLGEAYNIVKCLWPEPHKMGGTNLTWECQRLLAQRLGVTDICKDDLSKKRKQQKV